MYYHDVDMVGAGDYLLSQLLASHGISCPELDHFIANREDILSLVNKDRNKAKNTVNTARFWEDGDMKSRHPLVQRLYAEYRRNIGIFYKAVLTNPDFDKYRAATDQKPTNHRGKFISHVVYDMEASCLDAMIEFYGIANVGTLIYDGLHLAVECNPDLDRCAAYVKNATGLVLVLKVKPMAPSTQTTLDLFTPAYSFNSWKGLEIHDYAKDDYNTYIDKNGLSQKCIHPITSDKKVIIMPAHMGLGKSEVGLQLMITKQYKSIIFPTCRKLQADDILKRFGQAIPFQHYSRLPAGTNIKTIPYLIIQYESLFRLMATGEITLTEYELFVLDEARQVTGQGCSVDTNHRNMRNNFLMLQTLLSKICGKILVMDADLEVDGAIFHLLSDLFDPSECVLYRYMSYNPMVRSIKLLSEPDTFDDMCKHIDTHLEATKLMVPFRSRSKLCDVQKELMRRFPFLKILVICQGCPVSNSEMLADINNAMNDYNLFMFTSRLTVGLDCQYPFQKIYVFCADAMGCTALNLMQMIGRARKVENTQIVMCISPDNKEVKTYDECLLDLKNNEARLKRYGDALCVEYGFVDNRFNFITTLHMKILACSIMMDENPLEHNIRALALAKHWPVLDMRGEVKKSLDLESSLVERQLMYLDLLPATIALEDTWGEIKERNLSGMYNENETQMYAIIVVLKFLGWTDADADTRQAIVSTLSNEENKGKDLLRLTNAKNRSNIWTAKLFRMYALPGGSDMVGKFDLHRLEGYNGPPSNFVKLRRDMFSHIGPMCRSIGLEGSSDYTTDFPVTIITQKLEETIRRIRPGPNKLKKKTEIATLFQQCLKEVGLTYKKTGQRIGSDRVYLARLKPIEDVYRYIGMVNMSFVEDSVAKIDRVIDSNTMYEAFRKRKDMAPMTLTVTHREEVVEVIPKKRRRVVKKTMTTIASIPTISHTRVVEDKPLCKADQFLLFLTSQCQ
jgi:hypothetical protein